MNVDRTHLAWMMWTLLMVTVAAALYLAVPAGLTSSSWQLLSFGLAGSALALFCGLLALRKVLVRRPLFRSWQMLKSQFWTKGHIYGGLLGVLLLHMHAGFRTGGPCTRVMMMLLWIIVASGVMGLLFRQMQALAALGRDGKAAVGKSIIAGGEEVCRRMHIPLSVSLLCLAVVHAVSALFF